MTQAGDGFGLGSPPGGYGGGSGRGGAPSGGGPSEMPSILGGGPVPVGGGYRPPKKRGSGALVALILVGVLALGGIVAVLVYVLTGKGGPIAADPSNLPPKQTSVAHRHLPSGCEVAVRASLAQVLEVPAVKTHLVPVLDEMQATSATDPDAKAIADVVAGAGIDTRRDIKDVALCLKGATGPASQQKIVMVVGGDLRPETLVTAVDRASLRMRERPVVSKIDGRLVARGASSSGTFLLGQAADGAIVLANDEALFTSATRESAAHDTEYALPEGADAAVVVGSGAIRDAVSRGGPNPFLNDVSAITRAVATASLAQAKVEVRLSTSSAQAARGLLDVYNLIVGPMLRQELARQKARAPGADVLMSAKPTVEGSDFVLTAQGTPADVENAMREVARLLREQKSRMVKGL